MCFKDFLDRCLGVVLPQPLHQLHVNILFFNNQTHFQIIASLFQGCGCGGRKKREVFYYS